MKMELTLNKCRGVDNLHDEHRLSPNNIGYWLTNCLNADIDSAYQPKRRPGYALYTASSIDFDMYNQSGPGTPESLPSYMTPMTTDSKWLYWNGRFYGTLREMILFSEVNTQYRDKRADKSVIVLPSTAYLIGGVEDGIWIGDERNIYFLIGTSPSNFTFIQRSNYELIRGSEQSFKTLQIGSTAQGPNFVNRGILITTHEGICLLKNSGEFINLTENYFKLTDKPVKAVSLIKTGDINQYIVILK